jgi:hypothetical protein
MNLYVDGVYQTPTSTDQGYSYGSQILSTSTIGDGFAATLFSCDDLSLFDYDALVAAGKSDQDIATAIYENTFNAGQFWFVSEYIEGVTVVSVIKRVEIPWSFYTGWHKFSDNELRLYDAYVNYKAAGYWPITMKVNSFTAGGSIPDFDAGLSTTLYPDNIIRNKTSFVNASFISNKGQISQNFGESVRGNYFNFGFSGSEQATIYSIEPRFVSIKNGPMGNNK